MNSFQGLFYDEYGDEGNDGYEESKVMSNKSHMLHSGRQFFDPPATKHSNIAEGAYRTKSKGYSENDYVKGSLSNTMPAPYKLPVSAQFGLRINDEDRGVGV
jgi:hypothetical protein